MLEPLASFAQPLLAVWRRLRAGRYWLYALAAVPFFTELIESDGALPTNLLGWSTEIVVGAIVALLAHKVRCDYRELACLARTDALTGLLNRRAFADAIEAECARSRRTGAPLSLLFLDLDGFKIINDQLGHDMGDRVLQHVGQAIAGEARSHIDCGFRFGGDEFAVLLPETTAQEAMTVMARIRERCAAGVPGKAPLRVSVSVGVAQYDGDASAREFMRRADAAMYVEKRERPMTKQRKC